MTADPLGRLLVNAQRGPLYVVSADGEDVTRYLDLRDFPALQLDTGSGERGSQSFAFHPDFDVEGAAGFGKFYTIHSSNDTALPPDFDPGGASNHYGVIFGYDLE